MQCSSLYDVIIVATHKKENCNMEKCIRKMFKNVCQMWAILLVAVAIMPMMQSCDLGDDEVIIYPNNIPNAVVTVKTADDNTVYLQLDDNTTLLPTNMKQHPFKGKEVRAFVNIRIVGDNAAPYSKAVMVNSIDSILTKQMAPTLGDKNTEVYGNDPIEILKGFPTVCEDNYLTLAVSTKWGQNGKTHLVNLVSGVNPEDPYEVELRQNAYGDTNGKYASATVAFSLKSLPKTGGKTVKLKVKYMSFSGEKTVEFDYKTKD